jgi:hypothetical protein
MTTRSKGLFSWPDALFAPQAAWSEVSFDSTVGRQCETHRADLGIAHSTSKGNGIRSLLLSGGIYRVACVVEKLPCADAFAIKAKNAFLSL